MKVIVANFPSSIKQIKADLSIFTLPALEGHMNAALSICPPVTLFSHDWLVTFF